MFNVYQSITEFMFNNYIGIIGVWVLVCVILVAIELTELWRA